ncbi:MAG TPA: ATP-dependent DNA helicase RecG [Spirochaetota bacterium]|nr:ATP-dependent DNA helicase RecG [Spirochaetota bacterium]HNT12437.1 ATP-dependent DNA helicase RecG [Spirochaetota bacterium]
MLEQSVQFVKGIGPTKASLLASQAGIETVEDLLYHSPRRYLDRSTFKRIADCRTGETVTVGGRIADAAIMGRGRKFLSVTIEDESGSLAGVFFGGIPYFKKIFRPGEYVLFSGKIDFFRTMQIVHPEFDFLDDESSIANINTGRVVPLYRSSEKLRGAGLDSRGFRRIIRNALDACIGEIADPLDAGLLERLGLISLPEAIRFLHFPDTAQDADRARRRLSFNELFLLQYYLALSRRLLREERGASARAIDTAAFDAFARGLPFALTGAQAAAIDKIRRDMERSVPMNRLLQGDVGSGKTVVSLAAALFALGRGEQTAVMAPTEVLAAQHDRTFRALLPPGVRTALLTGSLPRAEKRAIASAAAAHELDIVIGTHAVIQNGVSFARLGLIVIDEQHRFGVNQRAALRDKGALPDLLVMTATPIPRSLALTLYGDLEVSSLREKPAERVPVTTLAFPEERVADIYRSVEKYVSQGRQVFIVLPLIAESEKMDLASAEDTYARLRDTVFPARRVGLLHGRLPAVEKDAVMRDFAAGAVDILVTTTVVEVGVDVPNATVMVIMHPERFGLAQLHQLRGRVGRGAHQSFCILVHPADIPDESRRRIDAIVGTDDGFAIAEEDLRQRGAGEVIGLRQHGHDAGLEFTDLARDMELILSARAEAEARAAEVADAETLAARVREPAQIGGIARGIRSKRVISLLS